MNEEEKMSEDNSLDVNENNLQEEIIHPATHNEVKMEVHKHPHNITHKKKWTEYLLEFLMIFFAVFLGFIAENMREHISDDKMERKYIRSLLEDLKSDTNHLKEYIVQRNKKVILLDSLVNLLTSGQYLNHLNDVYYQARLATRATKFYSNERTMELLKNAGGQRFIRNAKTSDGIVAYKAEVEKLGWNEEIEVQNFNFFREMAGEFFNTAVFQAMTDNDSANVVRPVNNPPVLSSDKALINRLAAKIYYVNASDKLLVNLAKRLHAEATALIKTIQQEYDLENE